MTWLDAHPAVEKTSLFGTAVHAVLRSAGTSPEALRQALVEGGLTISAIERVVPSLEDVFLDVVDRLDRGRAA